RDLERLLPRVGLRHEELVDVDTELARVGGIQGVFGVDEGRDPALALRLRDDVQADRCLARSLRPEDLDDPPTRYAADAERDVERQRPRGSGGGPARDRVL